MTTKLPDDELLKEVRREIAVRERVFPRWVAEKKISQAGADHKLTCMRQIAEILLERVRAAELPL